MVERPLKSNQNKNCMKLAKFQLNCNLTMNYIHKFHMYIMSIMNIFFFIKKKFKLVNLPWIIDKFKFLFLSTPTSSPILAEFDWIMNHISSNIIFGLGSKLRLVSIMICYWNDNCINNFLVVSVQVFRTNSVLIVHRSPPYLRNIQG